MSNSPPFPSLPESDRGFIREKAFKYRFTAQELRQITEIALDFSLWNEPSIIEAWPIDKDLEPGKETKKALLKRLHEHWNTLKIQPKYPQDHQSQAQASYPKPELIMREKDTLGLGRCPVASTKTRCCNLLTLDAVENCGFDCSYCSIQSFYHGNKIHFDSRFAGKLKNLRLDPKQIYHIGTGQSSDSLMWGNKNGVLDSLIAFALNNPNVILELKTKSKNIAYLLRQPVPRNIICSWSLNTPTIISHEEHHTASLEKRLDAARRIADKGLVVGFHFHPMVHYDGWREQYCTVFETLLDRFDPSEVAMISLGTLTFIKPVIRQIRSRNFKSKILQMPMVDADGKLSYPVETKLEMFSCAFENLKPWHDQVFFYLCMEKHRLWNEVFGYEYRSNEAFETAMKHSYVEKITNSPFIASR
ncbi:MAG: DNA photolyase [Gammaproteobacteria bacterium]|nr:DNA photolyase [Gammaproteobacteria bacterium]